MSSKIMELLKNKTEEVAENIDDRNVSKALMRLAEARNAEEVHDAMEELNLSDFYKLKVSAGNLLGIPHKRYVYSVRGGSLEVDNLSQGHLRDIHSPKAQHHQLTDLVLEDRAEGGSLWSTLAKVAKHTLLAKPIYDAGKKVVNDVAKPVVKYVTSKEGLDAINTGLRIAELAKQYK